ncbi:hypothetical protein [Sporolactobacillus sp. KGMB 08714]|uniref:hypothetical protein n=1 Tax=Sporolactobacillus sp. KGMB 08714 TaxID=3064704 RepID=UPI002FBEBAB1
MIKKSIYYKPETEQQIENLMSSDESLSQFFVRLVHNAALYQERMNQIDVLMYQINITKKLVDECVGQNRVIIDLLNTPLHNSDYLRVFTAEKDPSDVLKEALKAESDRKRIFWTKKHSHPKPAESENS